jgi:hypothetical protein
MDDQEKATQHHIDDYLSKPRPVDPTAAFLRHRGLEGFKLSHTHTCSDGGDIHTVIMIFGRGDAPDVLQARREAGTD